MSPHTPDEVRAPVPHKVCCPTGEDDRPQRRPSHHGLGPMAPHVDNDIVLCYNAPWMAGVSRPLPRCLAERIETKNPQEESHERH